MRIIGHRGARNIWAENSLGGFRNVCELKVQAVELDVHLSSDGEIMVIHDPLLETAKHLEEVALKDGYFIERKLYPNVDFYSGIIMRAAGVPIDMFPVLFAIGRLPGWIANFHEVSTNPKTRIYRPRQIYAGPTARKYVKLADRG